MMKVSLWLICFPQFVLRVCSCRYPGAWESEMSRQGKGKRDEVGGEGKKSENKNEKKKSSTKDFII